jgi:uncharacterized protein
MPVTPSQNEEEYFAKEEAERLRKLSAEHRAHMQQTDRDRAKELHHMKCPKCGMDLGVVHFGDVAVDKCFNCGGIWLDNGELEKLQKKEAGFLRRMMSVFDV